MDERLKQKLSKLPDSPGVYFHKNASGEIIYVGKAAVLKNRVRQYFQKSKKDVKTEALVAEIYDTDWITVDTEMDALFLESEMIKRYMPKWNILLRDDKTVSYVRISMQEEVHSMIKPLTSGRFMANRWWRSPSGCSVGFSRITRSRMMAKNPSIRILALRQGLKLANVRQKIIKEICAN